MKTDVQGRLSQTLENLIDEILAAKSQKNIDEPCKKFFKAFVGGRKNSIEHNKNWELLKGLRKSRLNELLFIISSEPPLLGIPLWLMGVVPMGDAEEGYFANKHDIPDHRN